jgi:Ankyrin repeats (3 copies)/Ankyrin repeat
VSTIAQYGSSWLLIVTSYKVAQPVHAAGADVCHASQDCKLMHCAAQSGNIAAVKWLQALRLDARAVSADDQLLPLHYACEHNQLQMAEYLLALPRAAGDIHARTFMDSTPLHFAAEHKADSIVQLLLQLGAEYDAKDYIGCTPLMCAGSLPVVELLLAAGADATTTATDGITVLHNQAVRGACAATVCLLLKAGADPTALTCNGSTLAHLAGVNGHFALEAFLSRAADDYRKKHPTVNSAVGDSSGKSDSRRTSSGGSSSSGVIGSGAADSDIAGRDTSGSSTTATFSATTDADHSATAAAAGDGKQDDSRTATGDAQSDDTSTAQQQQQQQRTSRKVKQPCANCSTPTTKLCRRCAAVYYCSVECQKVCFTDAQHKA